MAVMLTSWKAFFARKELRTRRSKASSAAFHREKEVLELLNLVSHANIVPLLASYIHGDTYNMIFPLAGGDLEDMFTGRVNISSFTDDAIWLQVLGITSALATLHKFQYSTDMAFELSKIGYHHDLKPQNILIKEGTFLLADFGLARLKDIDRDSSTDHKYGTVTYGAPESQRHIGNHPIRVNRALDIWSWGCILSEIVTFTLLGSPGVIRFRQFRRTTNGMRDDCYFHDMKDVKQEVRDWLLYLNRISDAHQYKVLIGKTLHIVECMLAADPGCRPSAASIHESFCIFLSEAGINTEDLKSGEGKYDDRDSRISLAPTGNIAIHLVQLAGNDPQVFVETAGFVEDKKLHLEDTLDSLRTILPEDHPVIRALATYNRDGER
jgi:serine/threonine protein kinase